MALSVADVKNIVHGEVGGVPLMPASTTIVEGRIVTPQMSTLCSMGPGLGDFFAAIEDAFKAIMAGLDDLLINPLKALYNEIKDFINGVISYIQGKLALLSALVKTAVDAFSLAITAALAGLDAILAQVEGMLKEGLNQLLAALSFCSPTKNMPSVKKYTPDDFTSSFKQQTAMNNIKAAAAEIVSILNDDTTSDSTKVTLIDNARAKMNGGTSTLNGAILADNNAMAGAQQQNAALNRITQIAAAKNNENTSEFINSVINPSRDAMLTGVANVMKNPGSALG